MKKFFNGIKFFSDNIALINLGGTATASSAADDAVEAFNGSKAFGWMSFGEADDTKTAYLERNFGTALYGDTLIIANRLSRLKSMTLPLSVLKHKPSAVLR